MRSRSVDATVTVLAAFILTLQLGAPRPAESAEKADPQTIPESPLAHFEPFLNKTWKALVDPRNEVYDVARWERAIGGKVIRIVHSVADGAYGGETLIIWDQNLEELVYYYFTTAGFYTHGTMRFEEDGRLVSHESVAGQAEGVTEVEATQELLPDGRMRVRTRMKRDGAWEDRGEVHYSVDPSAEVILPSKGSG